MTYPAIGYRKVNGLRSVFYVEVQFVFYYGDSYGNGDDDDLDDC